MNEMPDHEDSDQEESSSLMPLITRSIWIFFGVCFALGIGLWAAQKFLGWTPPEPIMNILKLLPFQKTP